jgi:threonine 3-dehydrogenase
MPLPTSGTDSGTEIPDTMTCVKKMGPGRGLKLIEHHPVPKIGPTQVLIKTLFNGICGTDKSIYAGDNLTAKRVPHGTTIGHEIVGAVVRVGSACQQIRVRDRVAVECHLACWLCPRCQEANAHICEKGRIIGVDCDGGLAEYVAVDERNCWKVLDSICDRHAAIMDPLGNAMHTVKRANVRGKTCLNTGQGVIGLLATQIEKWDGAAKVIAVERNQMKLELAAKFGAEAIDGNDPDWVQKVRRAADGRVDVLLEMSGAAECIRGGLEALRFGGTAALLGLPKGEVALDLNNLVIFKYATILGINGRRMFETWQQVEEYLLTGNPELDPLVKDCVPMAEYESAFERANADDAIKVIIDTEMV